MREAASFIASQSASTGAGLLPALVDSVFRFARSWSNRRRVLALADVDDHLLSDIGLTRDDVRRALNAPWASDPSLELRRLAIGHRTRRWNV